MGRAKDIIVKVIPAKIANDFVKKHHYSGKVVNNSCLHFGCFLDGQLHGVMSYGSPLDKSKVIGLVSGTKWNEMLELNRMAFDEYLPRNSESRAISMSIKLIKKQAPHIKFILSFADGCQCGDGTIYRASGFILSMLRKNNNTAINKNGFSIHKMTLESNPTAPRKELGGKSYYDITGGKYDFGAYCEQIGAKPIEGFQLRYIYLIDKSCQLNCQILPYSKIDELGAGMYKGQKISIAERRKQAAASDLVSGDQSENGGLTPTLPLQIL